MILSIISYPNEILNQKSLPVKRINKELIQLGKDLVETLEFHQALGLAASQCGQLLRVLVMKHGKKSIIMYNPTIVSQSMTRRGNKEACLSFEKDEEYLVKRPVNVKVKYTDSSNKQKFIYLENLDARVFFHEFDHLLGVTMNVNGTKIKKDGEE